MAENSGGGSTPALAFVVGGLLVLVAIIAFFVFSGGMPGGATKFVDVNIKAPDISAPAKGG